MSGVPLSKASLKLLSTVLLLSQAVQAISYGFPYSKNATRGVNLGGWLVLEPWITPSLFDNTNDGRVVDEYTFGRYVPSTTARSTLKRHWDTFITENDFSAIRAAGLNHVRLPVGYWAYDPDGPYITGQATYVDKAVTWAAKYGIKVWIDLHGVPGSQNGFDNSGRLGDVNWHKNSTNVKRAHAVISNIAKQYANRTSTVTAIAVINEPASFKDDGMMDTLKQYYKDTWGATRYPYGTDQKGNAMVVLHDAFKPLSYWNNFMPYPRYDGVGMDTHIYQVFSNGGVALNEAGHVKQACQQASELAKFNSLWTFVGEWTTAPNDCAKYLNARGKGARYDGTFPGSTRVGSCYNVTGDASRFSSAYKTTLRKMFEAQTYAFEKGGRGWFYWTWKTEVAPEWSYSAGIKGGWIPSPPTARKYPNICG
ncbi:glycoside hydrolase family 5 protein [Auriculariales sp. MPI-PUGE-AT-0066]|nr:glycoside hydrolase family 5 protein [Auriculariales sp. MPI-PUGE-AT-0066]